MSNPLKIALVTDGIFPFVIGGMQKHAFYLAKYFLMKEVELTIFHCFVDEEIAEDTEERFRKELGLGEDYTLKMFHYRFPRLKTPMPGHYIKESLKYSELVYEDLKNGDYDFVYSKGYSTWHSLRNKEGLPPIGVQFHGLEMFQVASSLKDKLQKSILRKPTKENLRLADFIFTYGGKIKDILLDLNIPKEKIQIQYGGVDQSKFIDESQISTPDATRKFLFIGRNERRKGYVELKEAFSQIVDRTFQFGFIGPVAEEDKIKGEGITYFGEIKNAQQYFEIIDSHDVLVVPSISEGVPTVILESMARGKSVIATDVGAIADLVNTDNGILIQPQDVGQIRDALIEMIEIDAESLLLKQKNALKHMRTNFDWDELAERILKFIRAETQK